jgi:hypothetical protein
VVADKLLALAARRWPATLRAEAAREWAAELHEIRSNPSAGPAGRELRALRYAASLALARPPERSGAALPAGWWWTAVLFLFATPLCVVPVLLTSWVGAGLTTWGGVLLGRRRAGRVSGPLPTLYALLLVTGLVALTLAVPNEDGPADYLPVVVPFSLLLLMLANLAGRLRLRWLVPAAIGAVDLAVTFGIWLRVDVPHAYAALWFPSMLLPDGRVPVGRAADGMAASFSISDTYVFLPQLLLAISGFALGYLRAARRATATAAVPE